VTGAGASCGPAPAANTQGLYVLSGAFTTPLPFSAGCQSSNGDNGGSVDVPAGTNVAGTVVTVITTVAAANTPVIFPNGTSATLNVVATTPTSVTRSAVVVGGAVIGRVVCGSAAPYPLAIDVGSVSPAARSLGVPPASKGEPSSSKAPALLAGGLGLAVLAQLLIGRRMSWRRPDVTD